MDEIMISSEIVQTIAMDEFVFVIVVPRLSQTGTLQYGGK